MVGHLLAGKLISSLLITLKQNQVKVVPAFADRAWQHLGTEAWLLSQDFTQSWENFPFQKRCFFRQPRPEELESTTPLSPANWTSLAWSCTTSMISSSTSAKRSVAWHNSPLNKLLCVSQKVACLTCTLIRHWIANQSWLQKPALLDFPYRS